jgi:CubicO group peptidase (beta-lactamase class C family)
MKTHALVAYVVASLSMTYVNAQITRLSDANFKRKLETLLREQNVPIAAVGLIEDNKIVETKIFGSYDPRDHPAENILFSVASLTKPVSMMLIMTLASNDKWNIDEPLAKYWIDPDIKEDSLSRKLTSRLLLSHQGGFDNWRSMSPGGKLSFVDPPGTSFRYSGEGYEYLRHAVERKFNTPFDVLTDSLLFKHFEMHHSYMIWPNQVDTLKYAGR